MRRAIPFFLTVLSLALAAPDASARGGRSDSGGRKAAPSRSRTPSRARSAPRAPARAPAARSRRAQPSRSSFRSRTAQPSRVRPAPSRTIQPSRSSFRSRTAQRSRTSPSRTIQPSSRSSFRDRVAQANRSRPAAPARGFTRDRAAQPDRRPAATPRRGFTGNRPAQPGRTRAGTADRGSARDRTLDANRGRRAAPARGFTGTRSGTARQAAPARQSSSRDFTRTRDRVYRGRTARVTPRHDRYGYRRSHIAPRHHHHGHHDYHHYYRRSGLSLSFHFGSGIYLGFRYYYPYYHYTSGYHYAFFYPTPITYAYVPYGFYCDAPATYVTRYVYVRDDYAETDYETVDEPVAAESGGETVEPRPAAGSPTTERFLRDASEAFREARYDEAARKFRLAALSAPDEAGPLFALGQALLAQGDDAYAARVLRKAVSLNADLVKEPGDIVGVYKDQEEFDRVLAELETRAAATAEGSDTRFLLAAQRYFSGDPRSRDGFAALAAALPGDRTVALFRDATADRFQGADDLPPIK